MIDERRKRSASTDRSKHDADKGSEAEADDEAKRQTKKKKRQPEGRRRYASSDESQGKRTIKGQFDAKRQDGQKPRRRGKLTAGGGRSSRRKEEGNTSNGRCRTSSEARGPSRDAPPGVRRAMEKTQQRLSELKKSGPTGREERYSGSRKLSRKNCTRLCCQREPVTGV